VRHRWYSTAFSAWVGAVSHRLWEDLTHASLPGTSLGIPALAAPALPGLPWWALLHAVSSALGLVGWAWLTVRIARRGLLRDWHGVPPPAARAPWLFWSTAVACAVTGCVEVVLMPGPPIMMSAARHSWRHDRHGRTPASLLRPDPRSASLPSRRETAARTTAWYGAPGRTLAITGALNGKGPGDDAGVTGPACGCCGYVDRLIT
jgi:hypothetical protein